MLLYLRTFENLIELGLAQRGNQSRLKTLNRGRAGFISEQGHLPKTAAGRELGYFFKPPILDGHQDGHSPTEYDAEGAADVAEIENDLAREILIQSQSFAAGQNLAVLVLLVESFKEIDVEERLG